MTQVCLSNKLECLYKSPIVLFVLLNAFFRCSSNVNSVSKITPRCVWKLTWETLLLLKSKGGCVIFFNFLLNIIAWACLLRSGLKVIFQWKAESLIFFMSMFNSVVDMFISCTTENSKVSSANSLPLDDKPSGKSLI